MFVQNSCFKSDSATIHLVHTLGSHCANFFCASVLGFLCIFKACMNVNLHTLFMNIFLKSIIIIGSVDLLPLCSFIGIGNYQHSC